MNNVIRINENTLRYLIKEAVHDYIKAITSYGGDKYDDYEQFFTPENEQEFKQWLNKQPKLNGVTIYRGYTFDKQYFEDCFFEVGKIIGEDELTQQSNPSFTTSLIRAASYIREFGETSLSSIQEVLFEIQTTGKYFVDISSLSYYPEENEIKVCDGFKLKIIGIKQ